MILKLFSSVLTQKRTWKRQILNISFMLKNNCFQMIWNLLTWSWSFFHPCWLKREPERDKYLNISFMLKNNCFQMIWNLLTWSWSFFHPCWLKRGSWKRQILNISFMLKNNCFQMIWNLLTKDPERDFISIRVMRLKREPERDKY